MSAEPFRIPMPAGVSRVESGPIQFGNDWPALHLRGDNAAHLAMLIKSIMAHRGAIVAAVPDVAFDLMQLNEYAGDILTGVIVQPKPRTES